MIDKKALENLEAQEKKATEEMLKSQQKDVHNLLTALEGQKNTTKEAQERIKKWMKLQQQTDEVTMFRWKVMTNSALDNAETEPEDKASGDPKQIQRQVVNDQRTSRPLAGRSTRSSMPNVLTISNPISVGSAAEKDHKLPQESIL